MAKKRHKPNAQVAAMMASIQRARQAQTEEDDVSRTIKAFYAIIGLALHETEKFGTTRISRVYNRMDEYLYDFQIGKINLKELQNRAKKEFGLETSVKWEKR